MPGPLREQLLEVYNTLPAQLRAAAHWVIDHGKQVALLSMRDQARRAGVPPSTMTRLAQRLGFSGYDDVRALYADWLLRKGGGFQEKASVLRERRKKIGEEALASDLIEAASARVTELMRDKGPEQLAEVARLMLTARRCYVFGQRAGYSIAFQLAYICSLAGCDVQLLDEAGGLCLDVLRDADASDLLIAISVHPYTRTTVKAADYANRRGMKIVCITDSVVSPLTRHASATVIVGIESPSFFHTMSAAFVAVETIAALVASGLGQKAGLALARSEAHFDALDTYVLPSTIHRPSSPEVRRRSESGARPEP